MIMSDTSDFTSGSDSDPGNVKKDGKRSMKTQVKQFSEAGSSALMKDSPRDAAENYKAALDLMCARPLEVITNFELILRYALCVAWIKCNDYRDILKGEEGLKQLVQAGHAEKLPAIYLSLARAYIALNRFKNALDPIEKALNILNKSTTLTSFSWPGMLTYIPETVKENLQEYLLVIQKDCRTYHTPDAICRYDKEKCLALSDHIFPSQDIYFTDPDFHQIIILQCEAKCKIAYHEACWKEHLKNEMSDIVKYKDVLGRDCPTVDCTIETDEKSRQSVIVEVRVVGREGFDNPIKKCVRAESARKQSSGSAKKKKDKSILEKVVHSTDKAAGDSNSNCVAEKRPRIARLKANLLKKVAEVSGVAEEDRKAGIDERNCFKNSRDHVKDCWDISSSEDGSPCHTRTARTIEVTGVCGPTKSIEPACRDQLEVFADSLSEEKMAESMRNSRFKSEQLSEKKINVVITSQPWQRPVRPVINNPNYQPFYPSYPSVPSVGYPQPCQQQPGPFLPYQQWHPRPSVAPVFYQGGPVQYMHQTTYVAAHPPPMYHSPPFPSQPPVPQNWGAPPANHVTVVVRKTSVLPAGTQLIVPISPGGGPVQFLPAEMVKEQEEFKPAPFPVEPVQIARPSSAPVCVEAPLPVSDLKAPLSRSQSFSPQTDYLRIKTPSSDMADQTVLQKMDPIEANSSAPIDYVQSGSLEKGEQNFTNTEVAENSLYCNLKKDEKESSIPEVPVCSLNDLKKDETESSIPEVPTSSSSCNLGKDDKEHNNNLSVVNVHFPSNVERSEEEPSVSAPKSSFTLPVDEEKISFSSSFSDVKSVKNVHVNEKMSSGTVLSPCARPFNSFEATKPRFNFPQKLSDCDFRSRYVDPAANASASQGPSGCVSPSHSVSLDLSPYSSGSDSPVVCELDKHDVDLESLCLAASAITKKLSLTEKSEVMSNHSASACHNTHLQHNLGISSHSSSDTGHNIISPLKQCLSSSASELNPRSPPLSYDCKPSSTLALPVTTTLHSPPPSPPPLSSPQFSSETLPDFSMLLTPSTFQAKAKTVRSKEKKASPDPPTSVLVTSVAQTTAAQRDLSTSAHENSDEAKLDLYVRLLRKARSLKFGFTGDNYMNPELQYFGHQENTNFVEEDEQEGDPDLIRVKEYVSSWYHSIIQESGGPMKIEELEARFKTDKVEFSWPPSFSDRYPSIAKFLLQSRRFAAIDDMIATADLIPDLYSKAETELTESVSYLLFNKVQKPRSRDACASPEPSDNPLEHHKSNGPSNSISETSTLQSYFADLDYNYLTSSKATCMENSMNAIDKDDGDSDIYNEESDSSSPDNIDDSDLHIKKKNSFHSLNATESAEISKENGESACTPISALKATSALFVPQTLGNLAEDVYMSEEDDVMDGSLEELDTDDPTWSGENHTDHYANTAPNGPVPGAVYLDEPPVIPPVRWSDGENTPAVQEHENIYDDTELIEDDSVQEAHRAKFEECILAEHEELKTLKNEKEKLQAENETLKAEKDLNKRELQTLKYEKRELLQRISTLQSQMENVREQQEIQHSKALKQAQEKMEQKLDSTKQLVKQLELKISNSECSQERAMQLLKEREAQVLKLQAESEKSSALVDSLKKENATKEERLKLMERYLKDNRDEVVRLERQMLRMWKEHAEYKILAFNEKSAIKMNILSHLKGLMADSQPLTKSIENAILKFEDVMIMNTALRSEIEDVFRKEESSLERGGRLTPLQDFNVSEPGDLPYPVEDALNHMRQFIPLPYSPALRTPSSGNSSSFLMNNNFSMSFLNGGSSLHPMTETSSQHQMMLNRKEMPPTPTAQQIWQQSINSSIFQPQSQGQSLHKSSIPPLMSLSVSTPKHTQQATPSYFIPLPESSQALSSQSLGSQIMSSQSNSSQALPTQSIFSQSLSSQSIQTQPQSSQGITAEVRSASSTPSTSSTPSPSPCPRATPSPGPVTNGGITNPIPVKLSSGTSSGTLKMAPSSPPRVMVAPRLGPSTGAISKVRAQTPTAALTPIVPSTKAVPRIAIKPGGMPVKLVDSNYQKLMRSLQKMFPTRAESELAQALKVAREKNNNTLSNLSHAEIILKVDEVLRNSKKQTSMGLEKFGQVAWAPTKVQTIEWQGSTDEECTICMNSMNDTSQYGAVYSLQCRHTFHENCIRKWLSKNSICPHCRKHSTMQDEFPPLG